MQDLQGGSDAMKNLKLFEPLEFIGLENTANQCYVNSVLQLLYFTPEFRNAVLQWIIPESATSPDDLIALELQRFFSLLKLSSQNHLTTKEFIKAFVYFVYGTQQDISEFITLLFDSIQKFLNTHSMENIIKKLYEGIMCNSIKCLNCGERVITFNNFTDINLVLKDNHGNTIHSVKDSIYYTFLRSEHLTDDNQYNCLKCGKKCDAKKRQKFNKLPYILNISLTRIEYNRLQSRLVKINDRVEYPQKLKIKDAEGKHEYELFGVILHNGTPYGGHYIAMIKDFNTLTWYWFNDTSIIRMKPNGFTRGFGGKNDAPNAYMLAYRKIDASNEKFLTVSELSENSQEVILDHLFKSQEIVTIFDVYYRRPNGEMTLKIFFLNSNYTIEYTRFHIYQYFIGQWTEDCNNYRLSIYNPKTGSARPLTELLDTIFTLNENSVLLFEKILPVLNENEVPEIGSEFTCITESENLISKVDMKLAHYEKEITTREESDKQMDLEDNQTEIFILEDQHQVIREYVKKYTDIATQEDLMLSRTTEHTFVLDIHCFLSTIESIGRIYSDKSMSLVANFTNSRRFDVILKDSNLLRVAHRKLYKGLLQIKNLKIMKKDNSSEDFHMSCVPFNRDLITPVERIYFILKIVRIGGKITSLYIELTEDIPQISDL